MANTDYMIAHGANKAYAMDATTPVAALTGGTFNYTENTEIKGDPRKGEPFIATLGNLIYNKDLVDTFFASYLNNFDVSPVEVKLENNTIEKISSTPASKTFTFLHFTNAVGGYYCATAGLAVLSGATGDFSSTGGSVVKSSIEVTSVPAGATITIPATVIAALCPNTGATGATLTIALGAYGTKLFFN